MDGCDGVAQLGARLVKRRVAGGVGDRDVICGKTYLHGLKVVYCARFLPSGSRVLQETLLLPGVRRLLPEDGGAIRSSSENVDFLFEIFDALI